MQISELYKLFLQHPSIETDTRKLKPGNLFFALKGPNYNANHFAHQAINNGAAYAIVDEDTGVPDERIIKVNDVLTTLQALALYHREKLSVNKDGKNVPFIAITGSNGKTTSKELLYAVLSTTYKTYATEGNLNNHIGIPLTILKIKDDVEIAIIEMGANHLKEIEGYCKYAKPTHGIITNCGKAHLEGFGGIEGIRKGKGELFDYLKKHDGTAFIMNDYDYLVTMSAGIKSIITYGTIEADVTGHVIRSSGLLEAGVKGSQLLQSIKSNLVGEYNLPNILLAIAAGRYFKVTEEKIKSAIENYFPSNSRSQLILKDSNKIILDAYNANPSSMKAAIENFAKMDGNEKILFLGGMKELGPDSFKEHQLLIDLVKKYSWKQVILVGSEFDKTTHPYIHLQNSEEARQWFTNKHIKNSTILIKGSRSTKMEKVLD
ncbi:MAG: UDP-N-acetylmuramoyl-tripeptide--D-alanyl-D-alanine ligase [Ferruginibacter sp.]|nr:UDP-N-acetylmuramoyl-tripeptide--D-alanyl-D-alanine ligase [Ferruginibacter sp.]